MENPITTRNRALGMINLYTNEALFAGAYEPLMNTLHHSGANAEFEIANSPAFTRDPRVCAKKLRSANKALNVIKGNPNYTKYLNSADAFLRSSSKRLNRIFDECAFLGKWRRELMIKACVIAVGQRPTTNNVEIAIHNNKRAIFYINALASQLK